MSNKKSLIIFIILFIILSIISFCVILSKGNVYTAKRILNSNYTLDDINIEIEDDNKTVELIDTKINGNVLELTFKSVSPGSTFYEITLKNNQSNELYMLDKLYVHNNGIITYNYYLGDSTGSILLPISISILLIYILITLIIKYKTSIKNNLYQYKNIAYLGLIIFLCSALFIQIHAIFLSNQNGSNQVINSILNAFSMFSFILLPIAFITSILVIISNIILIKKEGFSFKNILGIILGVFLCFMTILPNILYSLLYSATWIDVHNEKGFGMHLEMFIESSIYICITYLECILLGTIILGIKSAKHIPKFDKDYIIILGCKIKKDGTLTNLLKGRVDRAIKFSKLQKESTNKDIIFVPSGGQGTDEIIPEGQAMKNYLLEQGISENNIIVEDKSKNTYENLNFSYKLINEKNPNANIAFSTTNYHVFRSGIYATDQNIKVEGIGSKTKTYFWVNAFIREFIATIFSEKKKHIITIISLLIFTAILISFVYLNNNL